MVTVICYYYIKHASAYASDACAAPPGKEQMGPGQIELLMHVWSALRDVSTETFTQHTRQKHAGNICGTLGGKRKLHRGAICMFEYI